MNLTKSGFVTDRDNKPLFAFKPQDIKGEYAYLTANEIRALHNQLLMRYEHKSKP